MYYKVLAERASFLKEKEEGVNEMCKIMDEMMREAAKEAVLDRNYEFAETLLAMKKLTNEEIACAAEITVEEVEELAKELHAQ